MTWCAHEAITRGSEPVLAVLRSDPLLAPFTYLVRDPLEHDWHPPHVAHGLPEDGLAFLRPVCGPEEAGWYGEPVLDWRSLRGTADLSYDPSTIVRQHGLLEALLPPAGALSFFKSLSNRTAAPLVFYGCSMWGGDVEAEYAFAFGGPDSAMVALPTNRNTPRSPQVLALKEGRVSMVPGDVLQLSLASLGFSLPSRFFVPHTRNFRWQDYRLT